MFRASVQVLKCVDWGWGGVTGGLEKLSGNKGIGDHGSLTLGCRQDYGL